MIQRIQSLYMLIAALANAFLCILVYSKLEVSFFTIIFMGALLSVIFIVYNIFKYTNRKMQFVINRLVILLNFILLGLMLYRSLNLSGEDVSSEKGIENYIPLASIVLLALANKAIKKDEELVKSVDRLR